MSSAVVRCTLIAIALVAATWLMLGYRAVGLETDGRKAFERLAYGGTLNRDEVARARSSLHSARSFNADKSPLATEGLLLAATGRSRQALAVAKRLVAEEPENLDGWRLLYSVAPSPRSAARARRRVQELNPHAVEELLR